MDISSIPALASVNSQMQLIQAVQVSVAKIAMDQSQVATQAMVKMMEQSVSPNLGSNIDISV